LNTNIYKITLLTKLNRIIKKWNIEFILTDMDEKPYEIEKEENIIKIGLYHGTIYKSITNLNHEFLNEEYIKPSDFKNYNLVLLGDIHKTQYLNKEKTMAYSGSLIQQNYSESLTHGYLLWDLTTKESEFIEIKNQYCYVKSYQTENDFNLVDSIELLKKLDKKILNVEVQYIQGTEHLIPDNLKKLENEGFVINSFKPSELSIKNNEIMEETILTEKSIIEMSIIEIYKKIMNEKNEIFDEEIIKEFQKAEQKMISNTNKRIKIKKIKFKNLMTYETMQEINFENLKKITFITGNNGSGKSSLIDILLCALFNKPSRGKSKNIIKNLQMEGYSEFYASVNEIDYKIVRFIMKGETQGVKFYKKENNEFIEQKYGKKTDTEKLIKEIFGYDTIFSLLSIYLQKGDNVLSMKSSLTDAENETKYDTILYLLNIEQYLSLRYEHTTIKKQSEKVIENLNLEIKELEKKINAISEYEEKLKIHDIHILQCKDYLEPAKENLTIIKTKISLIDLATIIKTIKDYENTDNDTKNYNVQISSLNDELKTLYYDSSYVHFKNTNINHIIEEKEELLKNIELSKQKLKTIISEQSNSIIKNSNIEQLEIELLNNEINVKELEKELSILSIERENQKTLHDILNEKILSIEHSNQNTLNKNLINEITKYITFNSRCKTCKNNKQNLTISEENKELEHLLNEKETIKINYEKILEKIKNYENIILNANNEVITTQSKMKIYLEQETRIMELNKKHDIEKINENIEKLTILYNDVCKKIDDYTLYDTNEKILLRIENITNEIKIKEELLNKIQQNNINVEMYKNELKNYKTLTDERDNYEINIKKVNEALNETENNKLKMIKLIGGVDIHKENLDNANNKKIIEIKILSLSNKILKTFDENNLIERLIKSAIKRLEKNMNNMLLSIVDYTVKVEFDMKSLKLIIHKVDKDNITINTDLLSGSQSFLISIILKCCLNKISSAYKSNMLFIDEQFNSIDMTRISKVNDLLDIIKNEYEKVLIISHDENLVSNSESRIRVIQDINTLNSDINITF
jgi:DNA repair exonuclease SbcCD ATPase subunit